MIAQLQGKVLSIDGGGAVLGVGGVGFAVLCPPQTLAGVSVGDEVNWHTSLVVRADAMTLYGFASAAERACFEVAQQSSGIGPKIALAVVAVLGPAGLADAIRREDLTALTRVPGIGRKGAQKMVIELKEKAPALLVAAGETAGEAPLSPAWREQVISGLQGLGWGVKDAEQAADAVAPMMEDDPATPVASLMRAALRSLARA